MQRHCHEQGEHELGGTEFHEDERFNGFDQIYQRQWEKQSEILFQRKFRNSGAGVKLTVHLLQTALVHMGVNLGRGDVGMAEHFLNYPQVGPMIQEVRGKGMPQQMRMDVLLDPSGPSALFDDLLHPGCGQNGAMDANENMALRFRAD